MKLGLVEPFLFVFQFHLSKLNDAGGSALAWKSLI